MGPEVLIDGHEVLCEKPVLYDIQEGTMFIGQVEVIGCQGSWWL